MLCSFIQSPVPFSDTQVAALLPCEILYQDPACKERSPHWNHMDEADPAYHIHTAALHRRRFPFPVHDDRSPIRCHDHRPRILFPQMCADIAMPDRRCLMHELWMIAHHPAFAFLIRHLLAYIMQHAAHPRFMHIQMMTSRDFLCQLCHTDTVPIPFFTHTGSHPLLQI